MPPLGMGVDHDLIREAALLGHGHKGRRGNPLVRAEKLQK